MVWLFTLAVVCGGCRDCAERPKTGSAGQTGAATNAVQEPRLGTPLERADSGYTLRGEYSAPFIKPSLLLDGELDRANHYLSTVRVKANSPTIRKECAGVLIESRWVLTAAHCVCMPQSIAQPEREEKILLDSSACATTATVTAVAYLPPLPGGGVSTLNEVHRGAVRPHPRFKILLDPSGLLESSHADLALILLDEPVKPSFPPVKLANTEARKGEALATAGYGDDESDNGGSDQRRFSRHQVVELPTMEGDLVILERPARPTHQDDSGGPCLREAGGTRVLVGISHRGLGQEPACTSTHVHAAWIHEELKHSASPNRSVNP